MGRLHEIAAELQRHADLKARALTVVENHRREQVFGGANEFRDPHLDALAEFARAVADLLEPLG